MVYSSDDLNKVVLFFKSLCYLFNSKDFGDLDISIQLKLFTPDGSILEGFYTIKSGVAEFSIGLKDDADVIIEAPLDIFVDVLKGKLSPQEAWVKKLVRVSGSSEYFFLLPNIFNKKILYAELRDNSIVFEETPIKFGAWRKPDWVLVINGSARRKRGFTWIYLEKFLSGIRDAGVDVEIIDVYDPKLEINPCHGCFKCWTDTIGKCIFEDDATKILEKFSEAYLTIFATPIYMYSPPAKLKALLDRTFIELQPFLYPKENYTRHPLWRRKERYLALFAISGYPEKFVFNPIREIFRGLARDADIKIVAEIFIPAAWLLKSLIQYKKEFEDVAKALHDAGYQLVSEGRVDSELLEKISKQYIPKDQYYTFNNLFWINKYLKKIGGSPKK